LPRERHRNRQPDISKSNNREMLCHDAQPSGIGEPVAKAATWTAPEDGEAATAVTTILRCRDRMLLSRNIPGCAKVFEFPECPNGDAHAARRRPSDHSAVGAAGPCGTLVTRSSYADVRAGVRRNQPGLASIRLFAHSSFCSCNETSLWLQ
jgi:hypothetical protein